MGAVFKGSQGWIHPIVQGVFEDLTLIQRVFRPMLKVEQSRRVYTLPSDILQV